MTSEAKSGNRSTDLWIESHQQLGKHPKMLRAARKLGIHKAQMVGHLHYLWWWALELAVEGDISGYDAYVIAEVAEWDGDPEAFYNTLVECGLIDVDGSSARLHDWDDYTHRLIEGREQAAARMKRFRERQRAGNIPPTEPQQSNNEDAQNDNVVDMLPEHASNVTRTLRARDGLTVTVTETTTVTETNEDVNPVLQFPASPQAPKPLAADAADTSPAPKQTRERSVPKTPPAVTGFNYGEMWTLLENDVGEKLAWNRDKEGKAVKNLLTHYPEATPDDFAAFLRYKRTTFRGDPNGEVTFTRYYDDFGAWWRAGKPPTNTQNGGNRNGRQPDNLTRKLRDIAAGAIAGEGIDLDGFADGNVLDLRPRPATGGAGASHNGQSMGPDTRPGA